ncbi:MAG: YihY/virulence factor BrkB family protein [Candidatus Eremiobacteraeota bacterium]|nr:YihY/virulence factor BrkB family protein [Candidatus Eremiobacteraeota bacterium]
MKRLILAFREAGLRFSRDGCAFLAQALAFNALFTIFPLAVLLISAGSFFFPDSQTRVLAFFDQVAPTLHDFIASNLKTYIYGRGVSSIIAFVFVIWSGKNLFMGLAYALDRALGVPKGRPLIQNVAVAIVMLPVIGLLLIVAILLPVLLSIVIAYARLPDVTHVTQLGGYLFSMALVFFTVLLLYNLLPNRRVKWHFAIPGASFSAIAWPIVQFAFAEYTLHVDFTHIYGALSAPLVLLLWFYIMGSIFLFGAQLCAGWAHLKGSEKVSELVDELDPIVARNGSAGNKPLAS